MAKRKLNPRLITHPDGTVNEEAMQEVEDAIAAGAGHGNLAAGGILGKPPASTPYPKGLAPGNTGYGAYPADLTSEFPKTGNKIKYKQIEFTPIDIALQGEVPLSKFDPLEAANYDFTDPQAFAEKFGGFNRSEILKNAGLSKNLALDQLNLELQGLQQFAPAAAALKRSETSIDNQFNQMQREAMVNQALPGAREDLEAQRQRARAYAEGRVPDAMEDRALELGIRSRAADQASTSGFGASSSVARKLSDLTSVEDRIKLSEYGDQLLGKNLGQSADLFLPPTQYSDAGSQININPKTSAGDRASQLLGDINANTLINPATALQTQVQQQQYKTTLAQRTGEYNATTGLQNQQFNIGNQITSDRFNASSLNQGRQFNSTMATNVAIQNEANRIDIRKFKINNANQFRMDKFRYRVGLAGAIAGASQNDINTQIQIAQQEKYAQLVIDSMNRKRESDEAGAGATAGGIGGAALASQAPALFQAATNFINAFAGLGSNSGSHLDLPELPEPPSNFDINDPYARQPADTDTFNTNNKPGDYNEGTSNVGLISDKEMDSFFDDFSLTD